MKNEWGLSFLIKNDINVVNNFQEALTEVFSMTNVKDALTRGKEVSKVLCKQTRILESMFV